MVLYYTCSQSSKRVAEIIAQRIEDDIECMNEAVKSQNGKEYYSSKPYVIVSPIFNMDLPEPFKQHLEKSVFNGSDDIIFVAVCSYSSGNARRTVRSIMRSKLRTKIYADAKKKGAGKSVYFNVVVMPSTNVFARAYMSEKERAKVIERGDEQALIIAKSILKYEFQPSSVSLVGAIGTLMSPLIRKTLKDSRLTVTDKCVGCGKCVEACSFDNIALSNGKAEFLHKQCNHCSACVNLCPEHAVVLKGKRKAD